MQVKNMRSWIELGLFTGLLFLLVAIPYTIYLKASMKQNTPVVLTATAPVIKVTPTLVPSLTSATPSATTTVTCVPAPQNFPVTDATPAAYLFPTSPEKLCYPPQLPPYPFTWTSYHDYQHKFSIDIPTNWITKNASVKGTLVHIYAASDTASASATPTVSFAVYTGADPLATDAAYLKNPITRGGISGTVYTRYSTIISAIFPLGKEFLLLQASTDDKAFYAFEYMLDSLKFSKP